MCHDDDDDYGDNDDNDDDDDDDDNDDDIPWIMLKESQSSSDMQSISPIIGALTVLWCKRLK